MWKDVWSNFDIRTFINKFFIQKKLSVWVWWNKKVITFYCSIYCNIEPNFRDPVNHFLFSSSYLTEMFAARQILAFKKMLNKIMYKNWQYSSNKNDCLHPLNRVPSGSNIMGGMNGCQPASWHTKTNLEASNIEC